LTRDNPKPLGIFQSKGTPAHDDVGSLIVLLEVEGIPPPMLKPRISPHWKMIQVVGIIIEGMGVGTLGILMD
jgi:hypothetical protein